MLTMAQGKSALLFTHYFMVFCDRSFVSIGYIYIYIHQLCGQSLTPQMTGIVQCRPAHFEIIWTWYLVPCVFTGFLGSSTFHCLLADV